MIAREKCCVRHHHSRAKNHPHTHGFENGPKPNPRVGPSQEIGAHSGTEPKPEPVGVFVQLLNSGTRSTVLTSRPSPYGGRLSQVRR